jgi:hypothetical protein
MAKIDPVNNWVEYLFFLLLVLGFFLSISSGSAFVSYIIIFFAGMMGGRLLFTMKKSYKVPWILILTGFLIGFALGSSYGDNGVLTLSYIFGILGSYYLHNSGIIRTAEF